VVAYARRSAEEVGNATMNGMEHFEGCRRQPAARWRGLRECFADAEKRNG
jgi:hypothetical protein